MSTPRPQLTSLFQPLLEDGGEVLANETQGLLPLRDREKEVPTSTFSTEAALMISIEDAHATAHSHSNDIAAAAAAAAATTTNSFTQHDQPWSGWRLWIKSWQHPLLQPATYSGAILFVFYHVVFCLANGSSIIRPSQHNTHAMQKSPEPILGIMVKWTAIGIVCSAPLLTLRLGRQIPALYPSVALFLAPFLAQMAVEIDHQLVQDYTTSSRNMEHNTGSSIYPLEAFLATFAVVSSLGMLLSGALLHLAAKVQLANVGNYLPFSVMSGFFSAVGFMLWTLAFSVDTSGMTWKRVLLSRDWHLMKDSCIHHLPSLFVGVMMNRIGSRNPSAVMLLILATIVSFYVIMWVSGTTLQEAQASQWFWSSSDLAIPHSSTNGWPSWTLPPMPFANLWAFASPAVSWKAVINSLGTVSSMAFLFLLRSSIHATALKKNVENLVRRIPAPVIRLENSVAVEDHTTPRAETNNIMDTCLSPTFSEDCGSEAITFSLRNDVAALTEIRPKPPQITAEDICKEYGYSMYVVFLFGGFGNCPINAVSTTMYAMGADGAIPQLGSVLLLLLVCLADFAMIPYIPKTAFSSLLVLGAVEILSIYFVKSFQKTQDWFEWLAVPLIVVFSLITGFVQAIFLGLVVSLFLFVASFWRAGVVKFNATALEVRSRIERSIEQSLWLDKHGDLIQVVVLQNYLFFGNARSVLNYVSTMFEEMEEEEYPGEQATVLPKPKFLVIDLSLVSGMDTATYGVFVEIRDTCKHHGCNLYLCGMSTRAKRGLALDGMSPDTGRRSRNERTVRFFRDFDFALGKAEDLLLESDRMVPQPSTIQPEHFRAEQGFQHALEKIDELHGQHFAVDLREMEPYVYSIDLRPGDRLYHSDGGLIPDKQRGLFFIESGELRIERDASQTLISTRSGGTLNHRSDSRFTLRHEHGRMASMARRISLMEHSVRGVSSQNNFRVMRIGPGWVLGTVENALGQWPGGATIASSHCRLYHLPFSKLQELEKDNPTLVLQLYKMLTHLMARKEVVTIDHLHTLHNILNS